MLKSLSQYEPLKRKPKLFISQGASVRSRTRTVHQDNSVFLSTKVRDEYRFTTGIQTRYSVNTPDRNFYI
jgi:hypothetical protein